MDCQSCSGYGYLSCSYCSGGVLARCVYCEYGRVRCSACRGRVTRSSFGSKLCFAGGVALGYGYLTQLGVAKILTFIQASYAHTQQPVFLLKWIYLSWLVFATVSILVVFITLLFAKAADFVQITVRTVGIVLVVGLLSMLGVFVFLLFA